MLMFLHHPEVILSEITNVSSLSHFPNERLVVLAKPLSPLITLPNRSKLNPWQKSMRPILPGLCGKTSSVGLGFSIRLYCTMEDKLTTRRLGTWVKNWELKILLITLRQMIKWK